MRLINKGNVFIASVLACSLGSLCQSKTGNANVVAPCSIANTGNGNTFNGPLCTSSVQVRRDLRSSSRMLQKTEDGWLSVLVPGNEPTPSNACSQAVKILGAKPQLTILLGSSAAVCTTDRCPVLVAGEDLLVVNKSGGLLQLNAQVFDETGHILVKVNQNRPHLNTREVFEYVRPSTHELLIRDRRDNIVLHATFLNQNTLSISGRFFAPNPDGSGSIRKLIVGEGGIGLDSERQVMSHVCSIDSRHAAFDF